MEKETDKLVKEAFKEVTGRDAKKVMSMDGKRPSKDNSYLYNLALGQYEGRVIDVAKFEYIFFIYRKGKSWTGEFVPV